MFCPKLQKLLKPIYDLTRKGRPFIWGKEQQDSFEEIKCRLIKPPFLHMPNTTSRFHLYSDTSKFATGSALYQIQNGKPKLITYASKRLPEPMRNYSITELELCGLAINVVIFSHLLKRVDFDAGHTFNLCIIHEVTNYLVTVPIYQAKSEEIGEALIENIISKYCIPEYIIMDEDSAFMSLLMTYLLNKFNIKIRTVAPYNQQSLQTEHGIKSLSTILTKHLTNLGQMWPKYLPLATFAYKTFNTLNLRNYSPYELTYGRKTRPLLNLVSNPDITVSGTFREYYELLNKRLKYLHDILLNYKSKRLAMINKDRAFF